MKTGGYWAFCLGSSRGDDRSTSAVSAYARKGGRKWHFINNEDITGTGKDDSEQDKWRSEMCTRRM